MDCFSFGEFPIDPDENLMLKYVAEVERNYWAQLVG